MGFCQTCCAQSRLNGHSGHPCETRASQLVRVLCFLRRSIMLPTLISSPDSSGAVTFLRLLLMRCVEMSLPHKRRSRCRRQTDLSRCHAARAWCHSEIQGRLVLLLPPSNFGRQLKCFKRGILAIVMRVTQYGILSAGIGSISNASVRAIQSVLRTRSMYYRYGVSCFISVTVL